VQTYRSFPKILNRYEGYSLDRRLHLIPLKGERLRAEANGCPFTVPPNLISPDTLNMFKKNLHPFSAALQMTHTKSPEGFPMAGHYTNFY